MKRIVSASKCVDPFAIVGGFTAGVLFTSLMGALPQLEGASIGDVTPINNVITFAFGFIAGIMYGKTRLACYIGLGVAFLTIVTLAYVNHGFRELNQTHLKWAIIATAGLLVLGGKVGTMAKDLKPQL